MTRLSRLALTAFPHHLTQRGYYTRKNYFRAEDHRPQPQLLKDDSRRLGVAILGSCSLSHHVHVVVPQRPDSSARTFRHVHDECTCSPQFIDGRLVTAPRPWTKNTSGPPCCLWGKNRPGALLVEHSEQWKGSSAQAHLIGRGYQPPRPRSIARSFAWAKACTPPPLSSESATPPNEANPSAKKPSSNGSVNDRRPNSPKPRQIRRKLS